MGLDPIQPQMLRRVQPVVRVSHFILNSSSPLPALRNRSITFRAMSSNSSSSQDSSALSASKLFDLTGRTALVTGGGTGIGLMCAQALVANGAKVYIIGLKMEDVENAAKTHSLNKSPENDAGKIIPLVCDISSKEDIERLYKDISGREKQLHLLVSNAGVDGPSRDMSKAQESGKKFKEEELQQDTVADWLKVYSTNVVGHYFMSTTFLPLLSAATKNEHGFSASIVNISSISGMIRNSLESCSDPAHDHDGARVLGAGRQGPGQQHCSWHIPVWHDYRKGGL